MAHLLQLELSKNNRYKKSLVFGIKFRIFLSAAVTIKNYQLLTRNNEKRDKELKLNQYKYF